MHRVIIRLLKTHEEYRACERLQIAVWGNLAGGSELLSVVQKNRGIVLGGIARGKLVAFLFAFLGRHKGRLIHWSHMMAVDPRYRDRGLGFRMKLAHRKLAREQGVQSICWTYDPLQSRNATLNLFKLGAQVEEYLPDCYGHFPSRIELGLPSDRFVVDWRISSARVARRLEGKTPLPDLALPRVNETRFNRRGLLENREIKLDLRAPGLLVEIPSHTDRMRAQDLPLARRWRMEIRRIFLNYFSAGYRVADFIPPGPGSEKQCFYLLRRSRRMP